MNELSINTFYDLNKLPQEEGILLWGISMSKIGNIQSAEKCFEYLEYMDTKIGKTEGLGLIMLYGDYLYFYSDEPASILRDRYKDLMFQHKNGFLNILSKDNVWIKKAVSFYTFGQMLLDNSEKFILAWNTVLEMYKTDEIFRSYIEEDCKDPGHELSDKERMFILEEITLFYLIAKGNVKLTNEFIGGKEKWILQCYPGKPLKSEVYLFQKNPLLLSNPKNKFENCYYDLDGKKLYDYSRLDIDTFNFS